jgi:RHS repeat-associated protein
MGRLVGTTTQYSFIPGQTFTNAYAYDAASNRTSFTSPHGGTDTYAYNTLNQLTSITDSATGQFTFGYDGLGRRTALNRPNSVNTSYGYNSLSRLLNVLHQTGTTTIDGASYSYDNAGNRIAKTNLLNNVAEQYSYDAIYQLTQVVQGATTTESYSYDAVGNRLSSLGMSPYAYNSSNQLTSTPAVTFTYDGNGNTLTKVNSSGTTQYTWDFENRLSSVVLPGAAGTVTFRYDPFGRRVQKSSASSTTNYLYDGSNSVEEIDSSGALLARYAQGAGIDEPLAEARGGTPGFYEQDGLGSVTSLSGSSSVLADTYTYDAFGISTASTGTMPNPFQYTGRDYDPETGLRYYRARYYDTSSGRFLNEDSAEFSVDANFYRYTFNSPTNLVDPSGHGALDWLVNRIKGPLPPSPPAPPAPGLPCLCSLNLDKFVNWMDKNVSGKSKGACAHWIQMGLIAGLGLTPNPKKNLLGSPVPAKDWDDFLVDHLGFEQAPAGSGIDGIMSYAPIRGDIVVLQPVDGKTSEYGHIAVWDGSQWVSDFKQNNFQPYRGVEMPGIIYRYPCKCN